MLDEIRDLFGHMLWADKEVWKVVLANPQASADEKVLKYLHHIHVVQRAFNCTWLGKSIEGQFPEITDAVALRKWAEEVLTSAQAFITPLSEEALRQDLVLPWSELIEKQIGRLPATITLGQTALQVVMHSGYHRGQVNARLRELGIEPPLVDFIVWLWKERPEN